MKILKITSILLLLIIIFCILFIRVVPDYSNKYGFEIVSINDYKKYKQGYCLKEDRILSKDELFKRAILNYLKSDLVIKKKSEQVYCQKLSWVTPGACKDSNIEKIGYYSMDGYSNDNIFEKFSKYYNNNNYSKPYDDKKYFFLNILNAKPYQIPDNDIAIDLKSNTAGFKTPKLFYIGNFDYRLHLNESFVFFNDGSFGSKYIYLSNTMLNNNLYSKFKKEIEDFNFYKGNKNTKGHLWLIDNCGKSNIEIKIDDTVKRIVDIMVNGG